MHILPQTVKHLHFIGIGGIGMSGIAEVLHNLGYQIKGSDMTENNNTSRLQKIGIPITFGHNEKNIENAQVVIISSAIKSTNPEVQAARRQGIPVIQRAEMLAELMRLKRSIAISGTHGKTTTTSLMASLLEAAHLDPTVINGGIINAYNTNARLGTGNWIVVEADESDGSFTKLPATIAVITNIDPEHMEFYGTLDNLKASFLKFVENIPFYGLGILCADHPHVASLIPSITDRRIVTYGFDDSAMIRAVNLHTTAEGTYFDVEINSKTSWQESVYHHSNVKILSLKIKQLFLPMVGRHNVQNALAVVATAQELGISEEILRRSFENFKGVKRRFTKVGVTHGITIIDDYAHHPVEIKTVIEAAHQATRGNIIVVVQPHRYSRLQNLFEDFTICFDGADKVIIAPVYGAGEEPIEGLNSQSLAEAVRRIGNVSQVFEIMDQKELPYLIRDIAQEGDIVLCLGAGSITYWAATLAAQIDTMGLQESSIVYEQVG